MKYHRINLRTIHQAKIATMLQKDEVIVAIDEEGNLQEVDGLTSGDFFEALQKFDTSYDPPLVWINIQEEAKKEGNQL